MNLKDEHHPLFQSVIKDDIVSFKEGINKGYDPYKERLEGVDSFLLAYYLGREKILLESYKYRKRKSILPGWTLLKTPKNKPVHFFPHLSFPSYRVFKKVWAYSQKVKDQLEFKSLWFSKLFKCSPLIHFQPPAVEIKPSLPGVGWGLFADENLPKGTILGEYTGRIIKWNFLNYRPGSYRFQYPTRKKLKLKYVIDAEPGGNWTRLVNHSENPNVEAVAIYVGGILRMLYVLDEPVQKGSELTVDYGPGYWKTARNPKKI